MNSRTDTAALVRAMPLVFVLIWSTGFIVARYGMPHAPPMAFLAWRYLLSILCFLPWVLLARVAWPQSRAQWGHLAVTGVLMHAGYLGGVWAGSGRRSRPAWAGLSLGFAGLLLVVSRKFGQGGEANPSRPRPLSARH